MFEILLPITQRFHWELQPFFHLFNKFWGEPVTILSDTNPKIPGTKFVQIRESIGSEWSGTFSNNLSAYLRNDCSADLVIIMMADYWLADFVFLKDLQTLAKIMIDNPHIIRLQISNGMESYASQVVFSYDGMEIRDRDIFFRGSLIPGLWSKELLIKYLKPNQNVWSTEQELTKEINGNPEIKSYLIMPEVIKYYHIVSTSAKRINLNGFPYSDEIRKFIPEGFTYEGV